jgi:hypothetical protein
MTFFLQIIILLILAAQSACVPRFIQETPPTPVAPAGGYATLDKLPFREGWYGVYFQEDKVGYSHFKIEPVGQNFNISTDSLMRLKAIKKISEIGVKETVTVHPDLTMISFESRMTMNDKTLKTEGRTEGKRFVVQMQVEGEKLNREYPIDNALYHSSAISLMPALKGLKEGETRSFPVFNSENQAIERVEQSLSSVKSAPGPNGAVWSVKNRLGRSTVQAWLNKSGLTVLEKALDGSLITILEDESSAKQFIEKKTASKDMVLDVSLVRVSKPIENPEKIRFLKLKINGINPSLIPSDHRQKVTLINKDDPNEGFYVTVNIEDPQKLRTRPVPVSRSLLADNLISTIAIPTNHKEIVAQSKKIVSPSDSNLEKVRKLVRWTSENIKNEMKDSFTAVEVLRSREGECQSHANLYTAFARSREIPTKVVTGLVYSERFSGFLYHAWAESHVNGWLAVDPTLRQIPADATHIKIAGTSDDYAKTVLRMIGKIKIEVLDYK